MNKWWIKDILLRWDFFNFYFDTIMTYFWTLIFFIWQTKCHCVKSSLWIHFLRKDSSINVYTIFSKVYCNMNNFLNDNFNVEYDFIFLIHLQFLKITIVTIQIIHLTMFSLLI
jgi:hypothetical protein